MNRPYEVLDGLPLDSLEWHEARRSSIGASEVSAILGLTKWQTPLDVYRTKMGVPHSIDPNRAYFGHALEPVIEGWVRHFHRDEVGSIGSGFAARSIEWPWLTASPDAIATKAGVMQPLELKTSDAYAKGSWVDGVPFGYQAQVQAQHAVLGTQKGWLAVLHGGNTPELHPVDRDEEFIREVLVPLTREFWEEHVLAQVPPEPVTSSEAVALWSGDDTAEPVEADDDTFAILGALRFAKLREKVAKTEIESLTLELQKRLQDATTLTRDGQVIATWKPRAGARRLDGAALRADHPDLADAYTRQGEPTRTFLLKEPKATKTAVAA